MSETSAQGPATPATGSRGTTPAAPDRRNVPGVPGTRPRIPPTRARRWGRRLAIAGLGFGVVLVVARSAALAALPGILDRAARQNGLTVHYERLDVALLSGEVELAQLAVAPAEGGETILQLGHLRVAADLPALLGGEVRVRRVVVDGVDLLLEREADGQLTLARTVERARASLPAKSAAASRPGKPEKTARSKGKASSPPSIALVLEALRVEHVHVHVKDASVEPHLDARLDLDLRISDVAWNASLPRPARLELLVSCPPVLDAFRVEGRWDVVGKSATSAFDVALDRLHLGPLAGYLAPLGIEPVASELSGGTRLVARVQASLEGSGGVAATVGLDGSRLAADGREVLALDRVGVDAPGLSEERVHVAHVGLEGLRAGASRAADGSILALGVRVRPPARSAAGSAGAVEASTGVVASSTVASSAVVSSAATSQGTGSAENESEPAREPERERTVVEIGEVLLEHFRASFQDEKVSPAATLALVLERLAIRGTKIDARFPDEPVTLEARLSSPGVVESIALLGTAVPFAKQKTADLALALEGIAPRALAPYLAAARVESLLERGRLGLEVHASVETGPGDKLAADFALAKLAFTDGAELAGLDLVAAKGVRLDTKTLALDLDGIEVAGPRASARREASGALVALGLRILPPPATGGRGDEGGIADASEPLETVSPRPSPAPVSAGPARPSPRIHVGRVHVHDVRARFQDEAASPAATLALADAGLEVREVSLDLAPGAPAPAPAPLRAWLTATDLASVAVVGSLVASPEEPGVSLAVTLDDVTLKAAEPYLTRAGVRCDLERGRVELALHARARVPASGPLEATAALDRLVVVDHRGASTFRELLRLEDASATGVRLEPSPARPEKLHVDRVRLGRLATSARLEAGGALAALGFTVLPRRESAVAPSTSAGTGTLASTASGPGGRKAPRPRWPGDEPPPPATPPVLELARLEVGEIAFDLQDRSQPVVVNLPLRAGLSLGPLVIDPSGRSAPAPGPFTVRLAVPGTLEALSLEGTVALSPKEAHARATLAASGIKAGALAPRLEALGLESLLRAGRFGFELSADATLAPDRVGAELSLEKLAFEDGGVELAAIDAVHVRGVALSPGKLTVSEVEVVRPRARALRESTGALVAGGVRVVPRPASEGSRLASEGSRPASPEASTGTTSPTSTPTATPPATPTPTPTTTEATTTPTATEAASATDTATVTRHATVTDTGGATPFVVELGSFKLTKAHATFRDEGVTPAVDLEPDVSVGLDAVVLGRGAPPAKLAVNLTVPGVVGALRLLGTLSPDPAALEASLELDATGVVGERIAPYLGPRARTTLTDGRLHARLEAGASPATAGGTAARLVVSDVVWRDGASEPPLFKLDAIRVIAPRLDVAGGRVTVEELSVTGIETDVLRTETGEARLLGFALAPPPRPVEAPGVSLSPVDVKPESPAPVAAPPSPRRRRLAGRLPLVEIAKLELEVARLSVVDRARAGPAPVTVSHFSVTNPKKLELLGPDPSSKPALELVIATAVAPIVSRIEVKLHLAPFASEPDFGLDLAIDGLRGAGLIAAAPELAAKLDGEPLHDGRVRASVVLGLKTGRRDPMDFDVSRGFGADFLLSKLSVRDGAEGPVLAGVDEVHVDVAKVVPGGDVHVRSVEITKPAGRVTQEQDGLHVLGLVIKLPPPPPPETKAEKTERKKKEKEREEEEEDKDEGPAPVVTARGQGEPRPPEVRVDRLVLSGIDFDFTDRTCDPPLALPLTGLDVEIGGLTSLLQTERHVVRFDVVVKAGRVPLPKPEMKHAFGVGTALNFLGKIKRGVTGQAKKAPVLEDRLLFQEIAVKGELSVYPFVAGRLRARVEGLELQDFSGAAKKTGATLEEGVVDLVDVDVHFDERNGNLHAKTTTVISGLDMSEPPDGFFQDLLDLPAPLDPILFVLRDEEGAIPVPLEIAVPRKGKRLVPTKAQITKVVLSVFRDLCLNALKSSPFRIAGTVGDFGKDALEIVPGSQFVPGFGGEPVPEEPVVLDFAPGDVAISSSNAAGLATLARKLRANEHLVLNLRHDLGGGDLAFAKRVANPGPQDRRDLLARLESRRAEFERVRADGAAEARAALAAGLGHEADSVRRRLASVEGELARVASGLDQVHDLEREGAERQAERRTRQAALELARTRLEGLKAALVALGVEKVDERVRLGRPRVEEAEGSGGGAVTAVLREKKR